MARTRARSAGLTVLSARGHDAGSAFAFGACLQLFEPVLAETRLRERLLVGAAGVASPLLDAARADARADRAAFGADRIFGLLHGLYWLTASRSEEQPLMLALEDAQWLDEPATLERGLAELAATEARGVRDPVHALGRAGDLRSLRRPSTASVDELDRLLAGREPAYDGERPCSPSSPSSARWRWRRPAARCASSPGGRWEAAPVAPPRVTNQTAVH